MSQINVEEGEISLNERNSISGSVGLHNLTSQRARFQPVRIKALLSLFESEDDDTEPRDSDDNSDTESLQALPDDGEANNNAQISPNREDPLPEALATKNVENEIGISMTQNASINEQFVDNFELNKSEELKQSDRQISHDLNSFQSQSNVSSSSLRNTNLAVPFKHVFNNADNVDSKRRTMFTPQAAINPFRKRMYSQNSVRPDIKFETRLENPIDFDNQCNPKEATRDSTMETPMKRESVVKSNEDLCLGQKQALETPQTKLSNKYSKDIPETPGLIFSHWAQNNLFQTPTHNPVILSKKEGQVNHQIQDIRLQPHRFCPSQSGIVRRPLSEAVHLNQGLSNHENSDDNHIVEHQSIVKSNLLAKENCPLESHSSVKGNVVNRIVQSLQEGHRQHEINLGLSALSINEEKSKSQTGLEMGNAVSLMSREQKDHELMSNKAGISDQIIVRNGCKKRYDSKGILNSKNNNFGPDSWNARAGSMLSDSTERDLDQSPPVACESNPGNVQFSVAAKIATKKYGETINVKGSDYIVLGKLGQGMSGEVLRVQEVKTGELRAIKCVNLACIEKETAQGCLEEVSMLDKLRAPCIINMVTYEIKSHLLYVVMEMGDTDLSKLLKSMSREKPLPLTMILYYWTEMLTAVKHIHDNGVIHSDLKPANFLLVRGRLKLIDFGIASTVNADMTSVVKNTSLGTLNYISPEAINDIGGNGDSPSDNNQYKINFKSDVWSLGCILYSLVYGQTPFQHIRANWAKVNAITNPNQKIAFPPVESTTRRGYIAPPPFLIDVMRRCLQHDCKARPSVSQLLQIPYVGCNCRPVATLPSIPSSILSKIKHSLEESEWRQLLEALERRKPMQ